MPSGTGLQNVNSTVSGVVNVEGDYCTLDIYCCCSVGGCLCVCVGVGAPGRARGSKLALATKRVIKLQNDG